MVDVGVLCHHLNQEKTMEIVFKILVVVFVLAAIITTGMLLFSLVSQSPTPVEREKPHESKYGFPFYIHVEVSKLKRDYPHLIWNEFDRYHKEEKARDLLLSLCKVAVKYKEIGCEGDIPTLIETVHKEYMQCKYHNQ